jgi:hypothetical protein
VTVMNAFSVGLSFSIRERQSFVNSTGETSRLRNRSPVSTIEVSMIVRLDANRLSPEPLSCDSDVLPGLKSL